MTISAASEKQQIDRDNFVRNTKQRAKLREIDLDNKTAGYLELQNICVVLHHLAQKYVPNSVQSFCDFDSLKHATRALQRLGSNIKLAAHLTAPVKSLEKSAVTNSVEYRTLRNKYIAALSTIADITAKNTPPGHPEYQRGVREGYRRASDVAILFLEDIQTGVI
jgi:hypothetical protein